MQGSPITIFERLVNAQPPNAPRVHVDTACVLGGSIAGLLAARVLADHARHVVVIERDDLTPRRSVPQGTQVHTLLPSGGTWLDSWLPGFLADAAAKGATLATTATPATTVTFLDGHAQAPIAVDRRLLLASRPFVEARIRERVLALPNVSVRHAQATGLDFHDDAVSGVRLVDNGADEVLATGLVVDAMGRASRISDWLGREGYDQPPLERLMAPINYATAVFKRATPADEMHEVGALSIYSPGHVERGVSVAAVNAIEDDQWMVMLMGYGDDRPGQTVEEIRRAAQGLPPIFAEATRGPLNRDIATYHQAESRRRRFADVRRFPARLVSVGDAVASFNPVYGQGMSSATLHASCLSAYLRDEPDLARPAQDFFSLQEIVVDAAWAISAGGDSARLDAISGREVPEDVRQQRAMTQQILGATLIDGDVAAAFNDVSFMLKHPGTLADEALIERVLKARLQESDQ